MKKALGIALSVGFAGTALMWASQSSAQSTPCEKELWTGCLVESSWDDAKARACYNGGRYVCQNQQPAAPQRDNRIPDDPVKHLRDKDGALG